MKITKLVHSCLLLEDTQKTALVDPGGWSWNSKMVDVDMLPAIDRIIITHAHGDHLHPDFLSAVLDKNPESHVIANDQVADEIKKTNPDAVVRNGSDCTVAFEAPHEKLPLPVDPPQNTGWHFLDKVSLPGDSHSFNETKDVLAMPIIAPWGSTVDAVNKIIELSPKKVIPIHDWHHSDEGRDWLYDLITRALEPKGIEFIKAINGSSFEV